MKFTLSTRTALLSAVTALVLFLVGFPLVMLVTGSFSGARPTVAQVDNPVQGYLLLFREIDLLWNSIVVAVGSTLLAVLFGVSLAWITTRASVPGRGLVEQLILIPFYLTPLLGAVGWALLASPSEAGLLNAPLMAAFGLKDAPLNIYTPFGIIWVMGLYYAPFCYLFAASALRSMEPALEESSRVLGGGTFTTALRVTLPLILPAILGSSLLVFVLAVGQFGVPAVLGMPRGYLVLTTRIYQYVAGFQPNYAAAAAMGLSLFAFSAVGVYLQFKVLGDRSYTTVTGRGYRPRPVDVKGWRLPLLLVACAYVAVAVVLPLAAIGLASVLQWITSDLANAPFTLENYRYLLFDYPATRIAIQNTLGLALGGATLTLILGALIAWMILRTRMPGRRLLEYIAMIPVAVPAIVFSIGLLWAWIRFPIVPIYGTVWILLVCYVTIFLPYALRSISATLVQLDKSLEECAGVCGASWAHTMRTVTLPLLRPGLWAGWTLLFISIIKELSASALLYNSRTIVLSVAVFDLWVGSSFTRVAALSLIQALIIFLVLLIARRIGRAGALVVQ